MHYIVGIRDRPEIHARHAVLKLAEHTGPCHASLLSCNLAHVSVVHTDQHAHSHLESAVSLYCRSGTERLFAGPAAWREIQKSPKRELDV